ncbi:MAG: HNH endonuclease signature motif containing protein [Rhodoglobus sp.]
MKEANSRPWYGRNDPLIEAALEIPGWFNERVLPRLRPTDDGCIEWFGAHHTGYAIVATPRPTARAVRVTRVMWIATNGPIPAGLVIDHDTAHGCHNRGCVAVGHLEPVTNYHNVVVTSKGFCADYARRTECPAGHPLVDGNLRPATDGRRRCLTCTGERDTARQAAILEARSRLGMTRGEYVSRFGRSTAAALKAVSA